MTDPAIVALALSEGNGSDFEIFAQTALQIVLGIDFEPTGGIHDGGQDGFFRTIAGRPDRYVQISMQKDYQSKIRKTISRLKESGRTVVSLTYVTPLRLPDKDIVEAEIEKTTGVAMCRTFPLHSELARPSTSNIAIPTTAPMTSHCREASTIGSILRPTRRGFGSQCLWHEVRNAVLFLYVECT